MRLFYRIFTILIVPLIIIGGINYSVDPDYTLRRGYIPKLANALVDGKLVSGPMNTNSRLLKKQWIEKLSFAPNVLVLGSSRTMKLTRDCVPNHSFFNASVTNCTFQDMYAFLNLFEKKQGKLPKTIIICTDQWLFGKAFSEKRWLNNRSDFKEFLETTSDIPIGQFPSKWTLQKEWIKELFSVRYLLRTIKQMGKTETFEICDSIVRNKSMFLPDGSLHLPEQIVNASKNEIKKRATNYVFSSKDEYFEKLSSLQCHLFENMIQHLKAQNCRVILFIPPYNPETIKLFEKMPETSGIFKSNQYVLDFAKKQNLQVVGNSFPEKLNLSAADFYDGVHLKPQALMSLFKNLR